MTKLKNFLNEEKKENGNDKILMTIMDFFADNPSPPDDKVHALGEKLGLDPDKFEEKIYQILGSILGTGKAKDSKFLEKDADPKELAMGIKVEHEHTNNKTVAKRIALDHLAEIPDYYTRLKKMEGEAGIKD
jgi:hypothetical protein